MEGLTDETAIVSAHMRIPSGYMQTVCLRTPQMIWLDPEQ